MKRIEKLSDLVSKETYVRAVLDCNFAGFKDEIIETAVRKILEYNDGSAVAVEPVRHGYWTRPYNNAYRKCSVCGEIHYGIPWNAKHCPFCGARNEVKE